MKSVVVDPRVRLGRRYPAASAVRLAPIIYEMHVRGFTRHPSSGVDESARHVCRADREDSVLQRTGITAVELLPVFQFDAQDVPAGRGELLGLPAGLVLRAAPGVQLPPGPARPGGRVPRHGQGAAPRRNRSDPRRRVQPHRRGRRTTGRRSASAGSTTRSTTFSKQGGARYANYTGCGNTLNANNPVVRRMIVDSLRYWVERDARGRVPFRSRVDSVPRLGRASRCRTRRCCGTSRSDPALAGTKLIAEAWDAAGLYQVGSFVGDAWKEWNGRFRDDVRDFFRGAPGSLRPLRRPAGRQPRSLWPQGPRSRAEHQLRHLPRRLHSQRPRLLQPEAQRGERRKQSRRRRRQPQLELRCRGSDR